jgi:Tfp pilus assembly protein PilV
MSALTRVTRRARHRAGLTVVEVLVALILVAVGMLGIAGSTALALRTTLDSARRREASHRVASRFAQLAAAGCSAATAGSAVDASRSLTEQWSISPSANGFAMITDSVRWMSARGPTSFVLTTAITC